MRMLRAPLVHFVALGVALFALSAAIARPPTADSTTIVVSPGRIEQLRAAFAQGHRRPPTAEEVDALVRDWVREEVSYREAMALGLDRDDPVIRQRLRVKLEVLADDVASLAEPTDEQLRVFLRAHPAAFRTDSRLTFRHVYLDPQRRSASLHRDATTLLKGLDAAAAPAGDPAPLGDPFLLAHEFRDATADEIASLFGTPFAARLGELEVGRWQGPVASGYGIHLVRVEERSAGHLPALDEVRDAVARAWADARGRQATDRFYTALLDRYDVVVERARAVNTDPPGLAAAPRWAGRP